jgi:nucleoside 2-deoxyribosyltransferase
MNIDNKEHSRFPSSKFALYFAGSIRGGRDNKEKYRAIIEMLQCHGVVLTEHIGLESLGDEGQTQFTEAEIYTQDTDWIHESNMVIAEVTQASLGVGYELGYAEALGKRIICLFNINSGKSLSAMVRGNKYFEIFDYSDIDEIPSILEKIFKN